MTTFLGIWRTDTGMTVELMDHNGHHYKGKLIGGHTSVYGTKMVVGEEVEYDNDGFPVGKAELGKLKWKI